MKGKYITGIILLLISGIIGYFSYTGIGTSCSGWNVLSPVCWLTVILGWIGYGIAIWTMFNAALIFSIDESKILSLLGFWFFVTIFVIDIFLPDPIPMVDEVILGFVSSYFGVKLLKGGNENGKI